LFRSTPGGFIAAPKLSMLGRKKSINVLSSAIGRSAMIAEATSRARARSLSRKKRSGSGIAGTSDSARVSQARPVWATGTSVFGFPNTIHTTSVEKARPV
jgi:hypothetical protein